MNPPLLTQTDASPALTVFRPLLREWTEVVKRQGLSCEAEESPWWLDHRARLQTWVTAATRNGWDATQAIDGDEASWDISLTTPKGDQRFSFRAVAALQSIGGDDDCVDTIHQARTLATSSAVTLEPGTLRNHLALTFVIPHVRPPENGDSRVAALLDRWLSRCLFKQALSIQSAHAFLFTQECGFARNAAGWAFPGLGLFLEQCL
jgi:hypothetical protein